MREDFSAPDRLAPPARCSPHASTLLRSLQWQAGSNDCAPYTTATVINALHGLSLDGRELARVMNRPSWRGLLPVVRRIPNWATFPWGMVDVFRSYGLKARWRFLASPAYLLTALESSHIVMPVVGSWRPLWAHVMTLVEWDQALGWGFANTQRQDGQTDWLPDRVFRKRWQAMGRLLVEVVQDG